MSNKLSKIGKLNQKYNTNLNANLPCLDIFQSDGLETHVAKNHPNQLQYLNNVADILNNPDYIGMNPKEPNSIELIKKYGDDILIAIKLDKGNNYYYLASLYDISTSKINSRIKSGRLKNFT